MTALERYEAAMAAIAARPPADPPSDGHLSGTRCEISDLYFWLGEEAERVGFTPWQTDHA